MRQIQHDCEPKQDLGINITKINPAHLSQEHKSEYVECDCEPEKRNTLIKRLLSYGAREAVLLSKEEGTSYNVNLMLF